MEAFIHLCLGSVLQKKGDSKENMRLSASKLQPRDFTSAPTGMGLAGVTGLCHGSGESPWLAHVFQQSPWPGEALCEGGWGQHVGRGRD